MMFPGDVITIPSLAALTSIICSTLGDDVWREDATTIKFEETIAELCGLPSGIFCVSCTAANQFALHALLEGESASSKGILCDASAHIAKHEQGGLAWIGGAILQPVTPRNGLYLTLEDVQDMAVIASDSSTTEVLTKVIVLENTIGGVIVPLHEVQHISSWARQHGIRIHLDGARLWHAVSKKGGPKLQDYCQLCDTVALDFSKIIGAPGGTMVVGHQHVIDLVRQIRRPMGTVGQLGVLVAAAEGAFMEQFGLDNPHGGNTIRDVHRMARRVAKMWIDEGGKLMKPADTNVVWIDLQSVGLDRKAFDARAAQFGIRTDGPRLVFHHQVQEKVIYKLGILFANLLVHHTNGTTTGTLLNSAINNVPISAGGATRTWLSDVHNIQWKLSTSDQLYYHTECLNDDHLDRGENLPQNVCADPESYRTLRADMDKKVSKNRILAWASTDVYI